MISQSALLRKLSLAKPTWLDAAEEAIAFDLRERGLVYCGQINGRFVWYLAAGSVKSRAADRRAA